MAQNNCFDDIGNINRPPRLVSGEDYDMWKNRMESFFCYQEYGMWKSIKDAACAAVGTADFDWSFYYKEKLNYLKKEISSLKHEQTNLETQIDDLLVKLKATRAELAEQKVHVEKYEFASKKLQRLLDSETTYSDSSETSEAPLLPTNEVTLKTTKSGKVIQTNRPSPFIPSIPVPSPTKQIKIIYPPEGRKLKVEHGQSSTSTIPQSKSNQPRKMFDICHAPGERPPYVQKTLEEATFEHNQAHPWNFKDLFKRKDYVYFQRDKLAKSFFVSPIAVQATPKRKPIYRRTPTEKPTFNRKTKKEKHVSVETSAASKNAVDHPSAATKFAADQPKPSATNATSAADRVKRSRKSLPQQWKAKSTASIPQSIIIGSIECKHTDAVGS
ncbi:hypothetical protein L1987_18607 [Smallanthus sonchifolius]|uniref:Uncharacterized protein n=1 Tax=Smallanthus sonchifolius TaxID=185202 RepID=A0ACB9J191_9ASTR|nr:hypothetical protein L1987_18607 [Smallanthus sonchifolius]